MRTLLITCLIALAATRAPGQCLGDFNADGMVSIDELLTAVGNALGGCQISGARFVDNGDGTVTDHLTGLVWEKKGNLDAGTNLSDPHDADNTYTWSTSGSAPDGTAFTDFLYALNGGTSADGTSTTGCFAGHCDWRLPTIEELAGIVDKTTETCTGGNGPCIDPTFGPTQADGYWSESTFTRKPTEAWLLDFTAGDDAHGGKTFGFFVRAVRGGS